MKDDYCNSISELKIRYWWNLGKGKNDVNRIMLLNAAKEFCNCSHKSWGVNCRYIRRYLRGDWVVVDSI